MRRGAFIALEGIEGCGKSTQSRRLWQALRDAGIEAQHTFEPGGVPTGAALRALLLDPAYQWQPLSELLLFTASRLEHAATLIEPAIAQGRWVVSDRFLLSTMVYQGVARKLGVEAVLRLHRLALGNLEPDVTIILDLPAEVGLTRAKNRAGQGADRFHAEALAFHETVRQGFLDLAATRPQRCVVVDASGSADDVFNAIWQACEPLIAPLATTKGPLHATAG